MKPSVLGEKEAGLETDFAASLIWSAGGEDITDEFHKILEEK
jgi:hypothetical protein